MRELLSQLTNKSVVVVGDVMIDRYLTGSVNRISPEAPVPVLLHQGTEDRLGGAANVALNIRALGSTPILCSAVGDDADGRLLSENLLPAVGIGSEGIVRSKRRCTTVKTRILGNQQQMLRIDREDTHDLEAEEAEQLLGKIGSLLHNRLVDALIFQDYNKGVLSGQVIGQILDLCKKKGIFTTVDPKKANFFAYKEVDLFKPNLKEVRESVPFEVQPEATSLQNAARYLGERLGNRYTMLTLSERGLFLGERGKGKCYPTQPRKVADVSGAGDTVISIATLAFAAGLDLDTIAHLSNKAGGQVCEFPGVVPVDPDLLAAEL